MDRFEAMRIFVAVADTRGFASAARQLQLSAPMVTRAVAALEARIGARLLHRTTRQVRVTETGERYLADCRRILAEMDEAEAQAGGAHVVPRGHLVVTAPVLFGRLHIAPLLLSCLDEHPEITARAFFVDRVVNLLEEGVDVALRIAHLPDSSLTAVRVGSMRRVIVASPAYLERHGVPLTPADLPRHDAVGVSATGGSPTPWQLAAEPGTSERLVAWAPPRVRLTVNGGEIGILAALARRGLARALSYQVQDEVASGRLRIVLADFEPSLIPVHLVYPAGRRAAAKVHAFIEHAAQRLRAHPALNPSATSSSG
jgi:DNA-binding transcriptional LysR family regulator